MPKPKEKVLIATPVTGGSVTIAELSKTQESTAQKSNPKKTTTKSGGN